MVIASRSLGARSAMMTGDIGGIEAQASDIAFLANYAQTLPQADIANMAAAGYSCSGMAKIFAAARTGRFKALVSLDGSIRYNPKICSSITYGRPSRTAVPLMFLGSRMPTAEIMERDDKLGPGDINTMRYFNVYVTTAPPMTHRVALGRRCVPLPMPYSATISARMCCRHTAASSYSPGNPWKRT